MARNKVDFCIFCGEAPCVCNAKKPTVKKARPPKVVENTTIESAIVEDSRISCSSSPAQKTDSRFLDAMKLAAEKTPVVAPHKLLKAEKQVEIEVSIDPDLALMNAAIRALAPLMHPDSRKEFEAVITSVPTKEEKTIVWKLRRARKEVEE